MTLIRHDNVITCPVTGQERTDKYRLSWSVVTPFDTCPQCASDDQEPPSLRKLNQERKEIQETS